MNESLEKGCAVMKDKIRIMYNPLLIKIIMEVTEFEKQSQIHLYECKS